MTPKIREILNRNGWMPGGRDWSGEFWERSSESEPTYHLLHTFHTGHWEHNEHHWDDDEREIPVARGHGPDELERHLRGWHEDVEESIQLGEAWGDIVRRAKQMFGRHDPEIDPEQLRQYTQQQIQQRGTQRRAAPEPSGGRTNQLHLPSDVPNEELARGITAFHQARFPRRDSHVWFADHDTRNELHGKWWVVKTMTPEHTYLISPNGQDTVKVRTHHLHDRMVYVHPHNKGVTHQTLQTGQYNPPVDPTARGTDPEAQDLAAKIRARVRARLDKEKPTEWVEDLISTRLAERRPASGRRIVIKPRRRPNFRSMQGMSMATSRIPNIKVEGDSGFGAVDYFYFERPNGGPKLPPPTEQAIHQVLVGADVKEAVAMILAGRRS